MKQLYHNFCKIEEAVAIVCMFVMMVIIFVAAVLRAAGAPLNWALDAALFLTAWSVFLGADVAYRNGKLVRVDILTDRLPHKVQNILMIAMEIGILIFLIVMFFYGIQMSISTYDRTFQGIPGFSYTWVTISIPVSCCLMGITAIHNLIKAFSKK